MGSVCVLVELWALHGDSSWQLSLLPCVPFAASTCPSAPCHPCGAPGRASGRGGRDVGMLTEIPAFNSVSISQQRKNLWFKRRKIQPGPPWAGCVPGTVSVCAVPCPCCPLEGLSLPAGMHHGAVGGCPWGWERVKPHLGGAGCQSQTGSRIWSLAGGFLLRYSPGRG